MGILPRKLSNFPSFSELIALVGTDGGCRRQQHAGGLTAKVRWLGFRVNGAWRCCSLHSLNEPTEMWQRLYYDVSVQTQTV